jgi:hypothetical protein
MGQYLALGIVFTTKVDKSVLKKYGISKETMIDRMVQDFYFEPEIYNLADNDEYVFNIKPELLSRELIPFLEKIFPLIDPDEDYTSTIEELRNADSSKLLEFAEHNHLNGFILDKYAERDFLSFNNTFGSVAVVSHIPIMLSFEGKILTECHYRHFRFFKYTIQQAFSEYSISKAMRVYITG